jgi:hypothetical protein
MYAATKETHREWASKEPVSAWAGVENSEEMAEWLFNHHFAAHCSDNLGFEVLREFFLVVSAPSSS